MPHYQLESSFAPARVCGVDEAGRGPWAGPVVAAAVMFRNETVIPDGLNDSKKLSPAMRDALYERIIASGDYAVGISSVDEIDTLNIWGATALAMKRAIDGLPTAATIALIDGNRIPAGLSCHAQAVIRGDGSSLSIAAASIIAKVTRDRIMNELHRQFPAYGFLRHMGYGTASHRKALEEHGPCPAHRKSFSPIRALLEREAA